jgi:hypothetical protein
VAEVYTVVCREGSHEYSYRDVNSFFDRAIADELRAKAQATHDELKKRIPGKGHRLSGLNPFDPGYAAYDADAYYYVSVIRVSEAIPADLAAGHSAVVLNRRLNVPEGLGYVTAVDADRGLGQRLAQEAPTLRSEIYVPEALLTVAYRGLTFVLELENGLVEIRMTSGADNVYDAVDVSTLTENEVDKARAGKNVVRYTDEGTGSVHLSYGGCMTWRCVELPWFHPQIAALPADEGEALDQLTRLIESWLQFQAPGYRAQNPELDEAMKSVRL